MSQEIILHAWDQLLGLDRSKDTVSLIWLCAWHKLPTGSTVSSCLIFVWNRTKYYYPGLKIEQTGTPFRFVKWYHRSVSSRYIRLKFILSSECSNIFTSVSFNFPFRTLVLLKYFITNNETQVKKMSCLLGRGPCGGGPMWWSPCVLAHDGRA